MRWEIRRDAAVTINQRVQDGKRDFKVGAIRSSRVVVPTLVIHVRLPYLANEALTERCA
jgi:hypothetical protein